LSDGNIVQIT
jgi:hypothetical protein